MPRFFFTSQFLQTTRQYVFINGLQNKFIYLKHWKLSNLTGEDIAIKDVHECLY